MSVIGTNIKKIRGVKNLSQSDFADLFDMKRASIGSYEEGRAEPKIATVLQIANHFGISIDDLLTKELSVNDLSRFDIFKEELAGEVKHNLSPSKVPVDIIPVPYVSQAEQQAYLAGEIKSSVLPVIQLPLLKGMNYRAFELNDDAMVYHGSGAGKQDVVVGCRPDKFDLNQVESSKLYIFETRKQLYYRRLNAKNLSNLVLEPLHPDHYQVTVASKEVQRVWQVCLVVTKNIGNPDAFRLRLRELENEVRTLKNRQG
ncbi:MAG TPA: hypothetical protein DCG19_12215 [Cryomorphaceae bacterium]|nr:hypothetical protein [Owenweeksia sp.]HAD98165.1 hypothetical protein [Cryomorphaceae bacterium]HCQ17410.1 hypothetical protein [Cryomorphaceae bacterium]|tara:strand:- start:5172 stop:5945 length:774 start_codon:yes stop_codon:yes gene_type:complete